MSSRRVRFKPAGAHGSERNKHMGNGHIAVTKDRLVKDLKNLVSDSEDLMRELVGELSERGKQARVRLAATLASAKETCSGLKDKAQAGAEAVDESVREHPYTSIGVAFGIGLVIGVLVSRRR